MRSALPSSLIFARCSFKLYLASSSATIKSNTSKKFINYISIAYLVVDLQVFYKNILMHHFFLRT